MDALPDEVFEIDGEINALRALDGGGAKVIALDAPEYERALAKHLDKYEGARAALARARSSDARAFKVGDEAEARHRQQLVATLQGHENLFECAWRELNYFLESRRPVDLAARQRELQALMARRVEVLLAFRRAQLAPLLSVGTA